MSLFARAVEIGPGTVITGGRVNEAGIKGNKRTVVLGNERSGQIPLLRGVDGSTQANETFLQSTAYLATAGKAQSSSELTHIEHNLLKLFEHESLWENQDTFRLKEGKEVWAEFKVQLEGTEVTSKGKHIISIRDEKPEADNTTDEEKSVFVKLFVHNANEGKLRKIDSWSNVPDALSVWVGFDDSGNVVGVSNDKTDANSIKVNVADKKDALVLNALRQGIDLRKEQLDPKVDLALTLPSGWDPQRPTNVDELLQYFNWMIRSHNEFGRQ